MEYLAYLGNLSKQNYLELIQNGLKWISFEKLADLNSHIFIKPNLTFPDFQPGVMTSPEAVEAAIISLLDYTHNITIGDADSGGYYPFSMDEVYSKTGIWEFRRKYGVNVVNLSRIERKAITFKFQGKNFRLELPKLLLEDIDFTVTMPVPKIHSNTGVSLTFKNQWGCIPEPQDRLRLHPYFKHVVLEVNKAIKTKVAIIDGKYGLNRNGPMRGTPVELNWLLIANHIGAGARVATELMQIPLESINHLHYAKIHGFIPPLENIKLNCDLIPFKRERFYLKRELTDYPGLLAFHNSLIAYLGYFSPIANFLHRILYIFREPFYDYKNR